MLPDISAIPWSGARLFIRAVIVNIRKEVA